MQVFSLVSVSLTLALISCSESDKPAKPSDENKQQEESSDNKCDDTPQTTQAATVEYAYLNFELEQFDAKEKVMQMNIRIKKDDLNQHAINQVDVCITKTVNIPDGDKLLNRKVTHTLFNTGFQSIRSLERRADGKWHARVDGLIGNIDGNKVDNMFIGIDSPPRGVWSVMYSYSSNPFSDDQTNYYKFYDGKDSGQIKKGKKLAYERIESCFPSD